MPTNASRANARPWFIVASMAREPLTAVIRETVPYIVVLVAALLFLTFVPDSVLWLPRQLGYKG